MCTHCKHLLAPKDLVPVFSWLYLKGKCRYCLKPIQDNPLPELITPILFLVSYIYWPHSWDVYGVYLFVFWLIYIVGFVILSLYDLRWYLLPNKVIVVLSVLFATQLLGEVLFFDQTPGYLIRVMGGSLVGGGIFWLIFQVSKGKWIGGGDVKLGALLGAVLVGPVFAAMMIFFASVIGTLLSVPLLLNKKLKVNSKLPFGPLLMTATVIVYLFGPSLWSWYLSNLGV